MHDARRNLLMILVLVAFAAAAKAQTNAYLPPASYYATATGTGATLKSQLQSIVSNMTAISYGDARYSPQYTDPAPNSSTQIQLIYNRAILNGVWDEGGALPWNREHIWPVSRLGVSNPSNDTKNIASDQINLRPADTDINSDRGNSPFGLDSSTGTHGTQGDYYYPGDVDAGDVARAQFYMATRYSGTLSLVDTSPSGTQMGDLSSLINYHFRDVPDEFERRRNHAIYGLSGVNSPAISNPHAQKNRNPYVDHPEYVWSVFANQTNDSRLTLAGATLSENGGTTLDVNLGRVIVGGAVPGPQAVTVNKAGLNGTYYGVTTAGAATSSLTGRNNAFANGVTGAKNISVGLSTTTGAAGLKSGTVTIDNLDITTGAGGDRGANDGNDQINVSLSVLSHANPSFQSAADVNTLAYDFGTVQQGSASPTFSFDIFNLPTTAGFTAGLDLDSIALTADGPAFTADLTTFAGAATLAAGTSNSFTATFDTTMLGAYSATYTLSFSDENLSGATSLGTMTLTLTGAVEPATVATADFNVDGAVDGQDFLAWQLGVGAPGASPGSGDANGDSTVDGADLSVWASQFGPPAPPAHATPEPGSAALLLTAMAVVGVVRRGRPEANKKGAAVGSGASPCRWLHEENASWPDRCSA